MVRAGWGPEVASRTTSHRQAAGALLTGHDDAGTACVWAMAAGPAPLGAFLAWASGQAGAHLHLCLDGTQDDAPALARRATAFNVPATVWRADGASVVAIDPVPLEPLPALSPELLAAFVPIIEAAGADAVVEEGLLRAEVLGLEVARVCVDADARAILEVGVGRHDREGHRILGSGAAQLGEVVATIRAGRTAEAPSSPASQLAPERWLRSVVVAHPELVGASALSVAPSPVARPDLRRSAPAPAVGTDQHGHPLVVVCSVGVDPEFVPLAADARFAAAVASGSDGGEATGDAAHFDLVLAVPEGDDHPLTRQLAGLLRHPGRVVTVGKDWRHQ